MSPTLLLVTAALAAPPSSTLTGPEGSLSWKVETTDGLTIRGRSPRWSVVHTAKDDFTPVSTTHEAEGKTWTVAYDATGATITNPDRSTTRIDKAGAWDGDTVDVRLGHHIASGGGSAKFDVVDAAGGKWWPMTVSVQRDASCHVPCVYAKVQLGGAWKYVGPTWEYWYAEDGSLITFDGPIGRYTTAKGAR